MKRCCETRWYRERFHQVLLIIALILIVSYFVSFLNPVLNAFIDYAKLIWWAILLGFFLGGLIDYFIPREYVSSYLAKGTKRSIVYATGLGFLMSACSHGILALSIELYKKGASVPAVVSFLLAAPWANLTVTIMLFGFFGIKALFFIVSAIIIAIITGLVFQVLDKKNLIEKSRPVRVSKSFSMWKDIRKRAKKARLTSETVKKAFIGVASGSWSLAKMVLWWVLIGMMLAAVARAFVPVGFFHQYMGATLLGLFITLAIATLIEVCSEGSSPMAFEIFKQTGAFGNSFVFLMAGVATDYTEIGLIWSNIGRKAAIWLPVVTVPQVVVLGYVFNLIL